MSAPAEEIKEVSVDFKGPVSMEGGMTRRRRRGGRRTRKAQEGGAEGYGSDDESTGPRRFNVGIEKAEEPAVPEKPAPAPAVINTVLPKPTTNVSQTIVLEGGAQKKKSATHVTPSSKPITAYIKPKTAPVVVLAPAKQKPIKVMLVAKPKDAAKPAKPEDGVKSLARKTFKAKRVHLKIDTTNKTMKKRRRVLQKVDEMSDEQIRELAIGARLSRRESVAKVPATLLRQMIKDYQTVKGGLV
jgi:hypothetical protein